MATKEDVLSMLYKDAVEYPTHITWGCLASTMEYYGYGAETVCIIARETEELLRKHKDNLDNLPV